MPHIFSHACYFHLPPIPFSAKSKAGKPTEEREENKFYKETPDAGF
jgi:hypothetical protein